MKENYNEFKKIYTDHTNFLKKFAGENKKFEQFRNVSNFVTDKVELPWGERKCLKEVVDENNYNLQLSRGMSLDLDFTPEDAFDHISFLIDNIIESDIVRINELDYIIEQKDKLEISDYTPESFYEIGFRVPRLQKYYAERGLKEGGCDINQFNVSVGNILGFNCEKVDLQKEFSDFSVKDYNLVVCYHVLEHLSNPMEFLQKLHSVTSANTLFHFEIPVEPDGPHVDRAHLFPFHDKDLMKMIQHAGFRLLAHSNITHTDGPWIERITFFRD